MALRLQFLRHFDTSIDPVRPAFQWNLSDVGLNRSNAFVESWRIPLKGVWSSPELKASTTAEALSVRHDAPLFIDSRLREVDRGGSGLIMDYATAVELYLGEAPGAPQWEPVGSVRERVRSFLESLKGAGGNHLVVTHGLWMAITLSKCFNVDRFAFWRSLGFGQLIEADYNDLLDSLKDYR
jgi:broad specificity phosphatase PhoE